MQNLLDFLSRLKEQRTHFRLSTVRPDAVMVEVALPGERWELEFFADGHVETEVFRADPAGVREGLSVFWTEANTEENWERSQEG